MENSGTHTGPQGTQVKKWGSGGGKAWIGPRWARTRVVTLWNSEKTQYNHSYDYTKKYTYGVESKIKSDLTGLNKLIENVICKRDPFSYRVINVFVNLTSDLCTTNGNFNYHILTVVRGKFTWKNPIYFMIENPQLFDIKRMKAFAKAKADEAARLQAGEEIKAMFQQTKLKI